MEEKLRIEVQTLSADLRMCRFWLPVLSEVKVHRQKGSKLRIDLKKKKKRESKSVPPTRMMCQHSAAESQISAPRRHRTHVNAGQLQQGVEMKCGSSKSTTKDKNRPRSGSVAAFLVCSSHVSQFEIYLAVSSNPPRVLINLNALGLHTPCSCNTRRSSGLLLRLKLGVFVRAQN